MLRRVATAVLAVAVAGLLVPALADPQSFPGVTTTVFASSEGEVVVTDDGSLIAILDVEVVGEVIDINVALDIAHATANHLDVYLVAPDGTTVTLTTDNGGGADDVYAGVVFDDQAPRLAAEPGDDRPMPTRHVRNVSYVDLVPIGTVQPEGALGAMVGTHASGPWALVILDDQRGTTGTLRSWSLELSTMTGVPDAAPAAEFEWRVPLAIPDRDPDGLSLPVAVQGLPTRLLDVDVRVQVSHPRGQDLDFSLTSPSGTRIELATDLGGDFPDVYADTFFDDHAPLVASDAQPDEGGAPFFFSAVVPEGALGAFVGEDPNGDWTLDVVDDAGGNEGTLERWAVYVTTVGTCGNGVIDAGEECDDGNGGNGDGCDANCQPSACGNALVGIDEECDDGNTLDGDTCSSGCRFPEIGCDDCLDNDGNGLVDAADPNCQTTSLTLKRAKVTKRGRVVVKAKTDPFDPLAGPVTLVVGDGVQTPVCIVLGSATTAGLKSVATSPLGGGTVSVTLKSGKRGTVIVKGTGLDVTNFDRKTVAIGLQIGPQRFGGVKRRGKKNTP